MNQEEFYMMRDDGCQEQAETSASFRDGTISRPDDTVADLENLFFGGQNVKQEHLGSVKPYQHQRKNREKGQINLPVVGLGMDGSAKALPRRHL